MAEKPKGNIVYEILIVILIVALIGAIIYPSRVWKNEEEIQDICRSRMETIHQIELRYIFKTNTYSDSIPELRNTVLSDPTAVADLDTVVFWDGLVSQDDLKRLVLEKQLPEELRSYILERLKSGKPLGHLAVWDSLEYRLVAELQRVLADSSLFEDTSLDSGVAWPVLLGEDVFWNILDTPEVPRRVQRETVSQVRRGRPIFATSGWKNYRAKFYEPLRSLAATAERKDIWRKGEEDRWEKARKTRWEADMDRLSPEARDSLWHEFQRRFWDKGKELIWNRERNRLWENEGDTWKRENVATWRRVVSQKWQADRKKQWEDEMLESLPDSALATFPAQKDSLWKSVVEGLQAEEYEGWERDNEKYVNEVIQNLWERDRRVSWEDEAFQNWLAAKEKDMDGLWIEIKEELWDMDRFSLWREEEMKLADKINALKRLDQSVAWMRVLGGERIQGVVDQLHLPDSRGLWEEIRKKEKEEGSSLYRLGLVGMFRDVLLDSLTRCPLAHEPYLIHVVDTAAVKQVGIRCPIVDTSEVKVALRIDSATQDTTKVALKLPFIQKILGGGGIKNHGFIDEDGKKSWEKRGR